MTRLCALVLVWSALTGLCIQADEPKKPQWQRLLSGDDAKKAATLQQKMNDLPTKDDYAGAIQAGEELLALRVREQGEDHYETVNVKYEIVAYRKMAAVPVEERRRWGTVLSGGEPDKLEAKSQYADALSSRQTALKWCQDVLGEDHPLTARSYNNLAFNLNSQGKYAEARRLYQKAYDINRRLLGDEHPHTALSYSNLAHNLNSQGKYAEAQPIYQKALDIKRRLLGDEHPDTASSYNNLAANMNDQGKYAEAQPIYQKALDIKRRLFGDEHPDTALSYNNLAFNLNSQGKYTDAQTLFQKALDIRRKLFGDEHPHMAPSYINLAANLTSQGKYADAQPLYQKALDIQRRLFGDEHPVTATIYSNLAANLDAQGKYTEAQTLHQKSLDIRYNLFGDQNSDTVTSYSNLAVNLHRQGKIADAQILFQKSLDIKRKLLGDEHPAVATSYNNLASNLHDQGKYSEAQTLFQKALDICRNRLGDQHPDTARSYDNLARNLNALGKYAEAQTLYQKAIEIRRTLFGDQHPATALSYNNLAQNLNARGKYAEAQSLYQKALDIRRNMLGDQHPDTATSYNNLASNLNNQGKYAEAQTLFQKALDIYRKRLGEEHPDTATSYGNLASNLNAQGKYAEAQTLFQNALDIYRKRLGEEHPGTAISYNNVASNLSNQGNYLEAHTLYQKVLDIRRKQLGEEHPDTATSYNNLAANLHDQGKYVEAQTLLQKALDIHRKVFGEEHPSTASSYNNLAANLVERGQRAEAEAVLERAIHSYESSRLAGASGLDRASLSTLNPRLLLAALRQDQKPDDAWRELELSLARGLLDQQASQHDLRLTPGERAELATHRLRIAALQPQILAIATKAVRTENETTNLNDLVRQRQDAEAWVAAVAVAVSQREVATPQTIRDALTTDAACLVWFDMGSRSGGHQQHWACVVRPTGVPHWERLPGTGPDGNWTADDTTFASRFRSALASSPPQAEVEGLARQLRTQRIAPLLKHLDGVKVLYVIPANAMAGVPVELLAPEFTVSYIPSGTFLARAKAQALPTGRRMLALGDPIFNRPDEKPTAAKPLPPGGLLVTQVIPGSVAAKAGVQAGDVLLKYGETDLKDIESLREAVTANEKATSIRVTVWKESADKPNIQDVAPGRMGVVIAPEPAPIALANRRKMDAQLLALRGGAWKELPGTRIETDRLRKLFGDDALVLTDSEASEQKLESLRKSGELRKFRYLHLATHGEGNAVQAFESALILAQDTLPSEVTLKVGEPTIDGRLLAAEVREFWKLDAELVTLSACETAVGKNGNGEGLLGFAQAFLNAGSRSVCLSLWKVDDTATAMLMDRFYHNLIVKKMGKAAALDEAKRWLRNLSGEEALALTTRMTGGVARGKNEKMKLVVPSADPKAPPAKDSKPFAHPMYWAAFVLIGDPN